jgi:hypothetical protein
MRCRLLQVAIIDALSLEESIAPERKIEMTGQAFPSPFSETDVMVLARALASGQNREVTPEEVQALINWATRKRRLVLCRVDPQWSLQRFSAREWRVCLSPDRDGQDDPTIR